MNHNLSNNKTPLTEVKGIELISELINGSKIINASNDGKNWHLLVEHPIKLKDCNGRDDETWKYSIYETFNGDSFAKASDHNRSPREMTKEFDKRFWESAGYVRRMAERAKEGK